MSLTLNCPKEALPTFADISASPHVDVVCQEMSFENMSLKSYSQQAFLEHRKNFAKLFIFSLQMLEVNVIMIFYCSCVICPLSHHCTYFRQEGWLSWWVDASLP